MKKLICTLLILTMIFSGLFALCSCNSEENEKDTDAKITDATKDNATTKPAIPKGYTTYKNSDISFAYPSDWKKTEGSVTQLINPTGAGNNITVVYEAKNTLYETAKESELKTLFSQSLSASGMSISNFKLSKTKNDNIKNIVKITYSASMNSVTMKQSLFIVTVGSKTYTVTVTETNADATLVNNVFNTLTALK